MVLYLLGYSDKITREIDIILCENEILIVVVVCSKQGRKNNKKKMFSSPIDHACLCKMIT